MYKFIRVICALIISTLIMTLAHVHAEESGTVEFTFSKEAISHDLAVANHLDATLTNLVISGLEPNKSYEAALNNVTTTITTDDNGNYTQLVTDIHDIINSRGSTTMIIKGVSKLNYSIEYLQFVEPETRHQSNIEVYHNDVLVDTAVGKRNQGVQTKTYMVEAGSKEKIVLKDNYYKAFTAIMYTEIDGAGDPSQVFKYTAHITGLDQEDTVFLRSLDSPTGKFTEVHAMNGEINYDFESSSYTGGINIVSIPESAKLTITQHANNLGYLSNYQIDDGKDGIESNNTVPGIEYSTPELVYVNRPIMSGGIVKANSGHRIDMMFINTKIQTVVVNKAVEGNQGNRHEQFNFNAKFVLQDDTDYTGPVSISKNDDTVEQLTPDANNVYTFKLQHGDTVKLFNFDKIIKTTTITEADNDYQTKVAHDSEQPVDGKSVTVNIENTNANIRYTNSKSLIVPTGINLPVGGALFIIVGIGIILIAKKHKQVV